ncbi:bicaudal D-related protein homolog [Littorina saxatilis]|uniref:Uncharacterized protein n=1 Tax=Littorina saxatilis TaxID=31220 RepID=A0AAN9FYU1_9CAEN
MENWGNHTSPESRDTFRHHDDQYACARDEDDDSDWMDHENEEEHHAEGAWDYHESEELEEEGAGRGAVSEDDVFVQLAQKEQDLMLAAELGKALLDKNQELEQQVAKLSEDFSLKVEVFEQERHSLQSQLTQREAEYENTVRDLQDDISNLTEQLRHHDDETSAGQRKHVQDIRHIQQHNESLTEQLRQSLANQEALSVEAGQLREQLTSRRSNFHERVNHVDQLEDEVEALRHRHQELEVQIRQVKEERDALTTELENLHERLLLLEKQRQMQDEQIHHQHTEVLELRDANSILTSQLEQLSSRRQTSGDSPTLFSELSHLNDSSASPPSQSFNFMQFSSGGKFNCLSSEVVEEDDFEYDDDIFCDVITHSTPVPSELGCGDFSGNSLQDELFGLQTHLTMDSGRDTEEGGGEGATGGCDDKFLSPSRRQVTLTPELQDILKEMQYSDDEEEGGGTQKGKGGNSLQHAQADHDVTEMTYEPSYRQEEEEEEEQQEDSFNTLNLRAQQHFNDMFQAQQTRIEKLERRVQELEGRVQELQEERDRLQDAACGDVTLSQVLQQTRSERDKAMSKVSEVEQELSRLTADVVTLNGQLMDTIRKKVMISQELDQWQVDLSEVLAVQMHRRMKEQQKAEQAIVQLQKGGSPEIQVFKKETR